MSTYHKKITISIGDKTPKTSPATLEVMQPKTKMMAYQLLAAIESDHEAKADLSTYGNWAQHLYDQLEDDNIDD
jgi:hypothetical protein